MKNQNKTGSLLSMGAIGLGAIMAIGAIAPTAAQAAPINTREHHQQQRIHNGVHNGELTRREARHIEKREHQTNRMERHFRRTGGRLTPKERARLQHRLNQNSRVIYRQKHDRQDRHDHH